MNPPSKKKTAAKKTARKKTSGNVISRKKVSKKKVARKKVSKKKIAGARKAATEKTTKKHKVSTGPDTSLIDVSLEERWKMIAVAAYHKAEKRGFAPGNELQDWTEAEKEIYELLARDGFQWKAAS